MELKTLVLKEKLSFDQFKVKIERIAINTFNESKAVPTMLFGYCQQEDSLHALPMDAGLTTYPVQVCIDFMKDFIKTRNIGICAFLALGTAAKIDTMTAIEDAILGTMPNFPVVNISIQKPGKETYVSIEINPDKTLGDRYEFMPESRTIWSLYPQVN